ncbi:MAG: tetratricopeptide repeat protein [Gammaproteobacteria bacterium]|nr:tetratricopeptide repeat protein [Gammaproteobacteria bacterium]
MSSPDLKGTPRQAFENATRLLRDGDADLAREQLLAILETDPSEVNALRLLGVLEARRGKLDAAVRRLERAVQEAPGFLDATLDLAHLYQRTGRAGDAEPVLAAFCRREPRASIAWQRYADVLFDNGKPEEARQAQRRSVETDRFHADMRRAIEALGAGRPQDAETIYRDVLKKDPSHVHALVGLANAAIDRNVPDDAARLLERAMAITPNMTHVHRALSRLHMNRSRYAEAEAAARRAVELNPELADAWTTLGTVYAWGLKQRDAAEAFGKSLEIAPRQPRVLLSLGHVRKTLGETEASVRAYRDGLAMEPRLGEAWWSLADLKTQAFSDADVEAMQETMGDDGVPERERAALRFALGKAFEDRGDVEAAFEHYRTGNAIRHRHERFNVERFERQCNALRETFTAETLEARRAALVEGPIPIFVIGLPRSGSTLVDQILSSHSAVQGTMELPHILGYVRELDPRRGGAGPGYPACVHEMSAERFADLGRRYLEETEPYHGGAPYFVDKMPNNFMHVGLIARMLPDAVFVDTRRHPLGCCFSIYKQNFARGQTFGYDLGTLAAYYRNYVEVMAHWDAVLPGRVHRVVYERLVDDTESETRRLLAHCGLPFEEACLRFHETERVVRTASAEQVRRPIYSDAKTHWQAYEAYLGPLKLGLGDILETWDAKPQAP